jgi:hypothetical protein
MARFTVRVELHDGKWEDYDVLHTAMEGEGFSRFITDSRGIRYHMPWAEYNREADITSDAVLESAKRAANRTRKKYAVLVTESAGRTWQDLTPA